MDPLQYKGKYAECLVFNDEIEEEAVNQIYGFLNHEMFDGSKIRIMPDVHVGEGSVIGFTATLTDKISPNTIGVDIGCGVSSWNMGKPKLKFDKFDRYLRENVPTVTNTREKKLRSVGSSYLFRLLKAPITHKEFLEELDRVIFETGQDKNYVYNSLGTLGGGNHFIEIGKDDHGEYWLTIHSGSRNFGLKVATFHQKKAKAICGKMNGLEFLEGMDAHIYLKDMQIAQIYASFNRLLMAEILVNRFYGASLDNKVESVHNYIDFERNMIRKGAISAENGEKVVIPWNMRDGLIIGEGKGLLEWNWSAPHGAGRRMSRNKAKASIPLEKFQKSMEGIFSTCVSSSTLDEAPQAYKPYKKIRDLLQENVEIILNVVPVYNHKG